VSGKAHRRKRAHREKMLVEPGRIEGKSFVSSGGCVEDFCAQNA